MTLFVLGTLSYVAQASLELTNIPEGDFELLILLSPLPECWNYRCVPLHLVFHGAEDQPLGMLSKHSIN